MREQTLTGLVHPEVIAGRVVWSESGTSPGQLADKLRFGDPTRGWEGDERLALCFNDEASQWEVWRLDHNTYHLVAVRSVDQPLDERLIDHLVARDARRGFNLVQHIESHNDAIDAAKAKANDELLAASAERLRYEVRKAGVA